MKIGDFGLRFAHSWSQLSKYFGNPDCLAHAHYSY